MSKRPLAVLVLAFALTIPTGLVNVRAQSSEGPTPAQQKPCGVCAAEPCRSLEDIKAASTFDQAGRFSTTNVPSPDGGGPDINFRFGYDG